MSNNVNVGAAILAMGELSRSENIARHAEKATQAANVRAADARFSASLSKMILDDLEEKAKSQIHGLRARIEANVRAEDALITALKQYAPNHPLSDREVINQLVDEYKEFTTYDEKIIKRTYFDGILPNGAVVPTKNGRTGVRNGEPAYPDRPRSELLAEERRNTMMSTFGLTEPDMDNLAKLQGLIESHSESIQKIDANLAADKAKFFKSMSGVKHAEIDEQLAQMKVNLSQLELAVKQVPVRAQKRQEAVEEAARVEAAQVKLMVWQSVTGGMGNMQIKPTQKTKPLSPAERLALEARNSMMPVFGLTEPDMDNLAKLQGLIESHSASINKIEANLNEDKARFFKSMSGVKHAEIDEQLAQMKVNLNQLELAVKQVPIRAKERQDGEVEKARIAAAVEAAKAEMADWVRSEQAKSSRPSMKG